jgi:hypothetical protein
MTPDERTMISAAEAELGRQFTSDELEQLAQPVALGGLYALLVKTLASDAAPGIKDYYPDAEPLLNAPMQRLLAALEHHARTERFSLGTSAGHLLGIVLDHTGHPDSAFSDAAAQLAQFGYGLRHPDEELDEYFGDLNPGDDPLEQMVMAMADVLKAEPGRFDALATILAERGFTLTRRNV